MQNPESEGVKKLTEYLSSELCVGDSSRSEGVTEHRARRRLVPLNRNALLLLVQIVGTAGKDWFRS